MTHEEAIAYWYSRIDYEKRAARPDDLKLGWMRRLLHQLGDPDRRFRIVHVAGTKGKGSTSAMLAAILQAAGYRVGLFTSPHLSDVSERIRVNGIPITHAEIAARIGEVAGAAGSCPDKQEMPLTFFEVGTALGFLHFDCRRVDVAVVEVGLGGRLDSTNVCHPILSIITQISFDHMAQLGNSIERIAREKAGIIKPGVPVVCTATDPLALEVIAQVAAEQDAPLIALGRDFRFVQRPGLLDPVTGQIRLPEVAVTTRQQQWSTFETKLIGPHQAANAAGAVAAVEKLQEFGLTISTQAVARGLAEVAWPARIEVIDRWPLVIVDCAHNVASMQALVDTVKESFPVNGKRHLVLALSNDKQIQEILTVLANEFDEFHFTRYANNPRCCPPEELEERLKGLRPNATVRIDDQASRAYMEARAGAGRDDAIVVTGSVFLAGELRPLLLPGGH